MKKHYNTFDIIQSLKTVGIAEGDTIFLTTSLGMLGIAENIINQSELNSLFYNIIIDYLGPKGTLIVPAYSYTFGKHKISDPAKFNKNVPSEIGPFPNFLLKQKGVERSIDPFMSVSIIGGKEKALLDNLPFTSYGKNSIFERLLSYDVKCLTIGLGPNWTPFIHYLDWLAQVPFRYDKLFAGYINDQKKVWLYSVPALNSKATSNAHAIGKKAESEKIWKYTSLGKARIYACNYLEYFEFCRKHIELDPWLFANEKGWDIEEEEKNRIGYCMSNDNLDVFLTKHQDTEFSLIGEESDYIINQFENISDCSKYSFKTGQALYDYIVPEGWKCTGFYIKYNNKIIEDRKKYIAPYSLSYDGYVGLDFIFLHTDLKSIYPSHIEKDWQFKKLPNNIFDTDKQYHVSIETKTYFGSLKLIKTNNNFNRFLYIDITCSNGRELANNIFRSEVKMDFLKRNNVDIAVSSGEIGLAALSSIVNENITCIFYLQDNMKRSCAKGGFNPVAESMFSDVDFKDRVISDIEEIKYYL